ncbi:MAG: RNA methyltransferase, partial [Clostridia bacterium]|nr:RNA methyltransferase [Clostridia bacterium]
TPPPPANGGPVSRAAAAFGAAGAVVGPGAADPFGPKAVRGSAGAALWWPVAEVDDLAAALASARSAGRPLIVLDPRGEPLEAALSRLREPAGRPAPVFVLGNEGHGAGKDVRARADAVAAIDRARGVESLNVATAAALAFDACARLGWR